MTSSISIRPPILQASLQPPTHFLQHDHILALKLSRLDLPWHFFIWSVFDVNIQVGMNITLNFLFVAKLKSLLPSSSTLRYNSLSMDSTKLQGQGREQRVTSCNAH